MNFLGYLNLFFTFFKIGLFSFGGGYGMLPLMQQEATKLGILEEQFLNFLAISESTPGPIAVNMATFIGTSQGGFLGGVLCTLGAITPSIIIILLIVAVFKRFLEYKAVRCVMDGIKPVIVGLIFTTGLFLAVQNFIPNVTSFSLEGINFISLGLMIALGAFQFIFKKIKKKNVSPIILIIISAVFGIILF
ncbi:MAG: chromate transporter [Clostridia bacterium]|nr:chromate transporter [Clostridia bacterium]